MLKYGTIVDIGTKTVKIKLHGDNTNSNINYYYIGSYTPTLNDIIVVDTNLKIVLGKVVL